MMKKYNVAMTEEMEKRLEVERKKRALDSIPETIRYILSEYLSKT
jgi:Arc/MetJ-type ribon-helix-helix transcriptional regulator